jgi:transcriptional regulator with XRE-family HTH domain
LRKNAAEENSFSGALRRAIHKHDLSLTQIARQGGLSVEELDLFLTGERELPSSVIDRLVNVLGCKLVSAEPVR